MKVGGKKWVWPVLWALSIFATSSGVVTTNQLSHAVSSVAGGRISESGFIHFWGVVWWIFVKGWHALEFAILYLLARKVTPKWAPIIAASYAFLDEAHQLLVPSRGSRLSDVLIDCLGIFGAWLLVERSRYKAGNESRFGWLFDHRWRMVLAVVVWVALLFAMSLCPFGLVTLGPSNNGWPRP